MSRTKLHRVRKEDNFTRVHNEILRRNDVSWKAKGILVYILSLPDDWTIYLEEIVRHSTDGMTSFRAGWKELKDKGYVKRVPVREGGKIIRWDTYINETVDTTASVLLVGNPQVENQQVEKPHVENDKLLTTNYTNDLDIQTTNNTSRSKLKFETHHLKLAELLYKEILHNNPQHKKPNLESWANDFRLMMEIDKREGKEIQELILFSQSHDFWYKNILSAGKLREKYDVLILEKNGKQGSKKDRKVAKF